MVRAFDSRPVGFIFPSAVNRLDKSVFECNFLFTHRSLYCPLLIKGKKDSIGVKWEISQLRVVSFSF